MWINYACWMIVVIFFTFRISDFDSDKPNIVFIYLI